MENWKKGFKIVLENNNIVVFYNNDKLFRVSANKKNATKLMEMLCEED